MVVRILISLLLVGLLLPTFLFGCSNTEGSKKEDKVVTSGATPLIDTSLFPVTERATFALG